MLSNYIILVFLPTLVFCTINIRIKADTDIAKAEVEFMGEDVALISDRERHTFKLNDAALKDASESVFGKRCQDVYLREPTPWDVYHKYGWTQVRRTLRPIRAKVLSVTSKPVAVATADYVNNSNNTATYNSGLTQSVEETFSTSWSNGGDLTVGQEIQYSINIGVAKVGGAARTSYASTWGKATHKAKKAAIGSSSNVEIELPPHSGAIAKLMATRGLMEVEVEYEATVEGQIFCNYGYQYKGHYWYAASINKLQQYGNFPTSIKTVEIISIGFYADYTTDVTNL